MKRRLREACVQLTNELHHGSSSEDRERHAKQQKRQRRQHGLRNHNSRLLVAVRTSERLAPIKRERPHEDERKIDVRYISVPRSYAAFKLLFGMVRSSQPLLIIPTFRRIVAVAFATGSYGLLFQTLWRLSAAYSFGRLFTLMVGAIIAMTFWLLIDHDLWARHFKKQAYTLFVLNNLTTIISYYGILFILFLIAVLVLVTPGLLQDTLEHGIDFNNYLYLAWLAASISTVAGALGSSLESTDTVRNATYGYRQRRRYQEAREAQKFQDDEQESENY